MLRLIVVLSFLIVTVAPGFTQSRDPSVGTGNVDRAVPEAPVGHRQPRAADVPKNTMEDSWMRFDQDPKLQRALKGVCRGC